MSCRTKSVMPRLRVSLFFNSFSRGLVVASLNINSLLAHIDELRVFMSTSKIDILSDDETKLDFTIDDGELYLLGFEMIR